MKGKCKPDNTIIVISTSDITVAVGLNSQQKWEFETNDNRVKLQYKNIGMYISLERFKSEWEIMGQED